ncbi:28S ribosomal protein S5, mitochondrial [Coemansia sp. Benny D115]|nr:28S ribosomal protein S5, mitochondrial [Coemansia sp. Benny D115]
MSALALRFSRALSKASSFGKNINNSNGNSSGNSDGDGDGDRDSYDNSDRSTIVGRALTTSSVSKRIDSKFGNLIPLQNVKKLPDFSKFDPIYDDIDENSSVIKLWEKQKAKEMNATAASATDIAAHVRKEHNIFDTPDDFLVNYPKSPPRKSLQTTVEGDMVWSEDLLIPYEQFRKLSKKTLVIRRTVQMTRKGKIPSMYAMVVVGNGMGSAGYGEGKGQETSRAVMVATRQAIKRMQHFPRYDDRTIYHDIQHKFKATRLQLWARRPGFGCRVAPMIHEVCECVGIADLAGKIHGSRNPMNVIKAFFEALKTQRIPSDLAKARGLRLLDVHHIYYGAFSEVSAYDVRAVSGDTIATVLCLLQSAHLDVQQGAGAALGNLAANMENKRLIVQKGGLEYLVRQMQSSSVDAQANSAGCITNLAADTELKDAVARSGALVPLVRLARSRDLRVQRNAAGALLNMTHTAEHRKLMVDAGASPVLVAMLDAADGETRYYAVTALSNIAADESGRQLVWMTEPLLVDSLIRLLAQSPVRVQAQATLALRNLASDMRFQRHIVLRGGTSALLPLLKSTHLSLVSAAAACLRNLSIEAANEAAIIAAGLLPPLAALVASPDSDVQCHALATLRNLAANSSCNKQAMLESGLFEYLRQALSFSHCVAHVASEIATCLGALATAEQLWRPILEQGLCRSLVRLLHSSSREAEYNAFLALRALAARRAPEVFDELMHLWVFRAEPRAGLRAYCLRVLSTPEYARSAVRSIAMWLVMTMLGCSRADLRRRLLADTQLMSAVEELARARVAMAGDFSSPVAEEAFSPAELMAVGDGSDGSMISSVDTEQTAVSNEDDAMLQTWSLARQTMALLKKEPMVSV